MNPNDPIQTVQEPIRIVGETTLKPHEGKSDLEALIEAGNYDWPKGSNDLITRDNFPPELIGPMYDTRRLVFVESDEDTTSEEVLAWADKKNLLRPTAGDVLRLGIQHPELQRKGPYVALHEPVFISGDALPNRVLALWCGGDGFSLSLGWFDGEGSSDCCFVFVRPS